MDARVTNPFLPARPQQAPTYNPQQQSAATYPAPAAYAPPQQYSAPQPGVMVAVAGAYATPPPPVLSEGDIDRPPVKALVRRLLIIVPKLIERGLVSRKLLDKEGNAKIQDRLTADVIVLDGGPLFWGGNTPGAQQFNEQVPYVIKGMWLSQRSLIQQSEGALAARERGDAANALVLGRLWQAGSEQNSPYVLAPPDPATDLPAFNAYVQHTNPYAV